MKHKKTVWALGSILLLALLLFAIFQWWVPSLSAQAITEEEAKSTALAKYEGEILRTSKQNDQYKIELQAETGLYHIKINAENGEILSIIQVEQAEIEEPSEQPKQLLTENEVKSIITTHGDVKSIELIKDEKTPHYVAIIDKKNEELTIRLDPYTGDIIDSTNKQKRVLSEQEAGEIALKRQAGEVDDIDFIEPEDGTPYYLVEVETNDGSEAIIEIDAYTREVRSLTFEGDDEDDSE